MKNYLFFILSLIALSITTYSCKDNSKVEQERQIKIKEYNDSIFAFVQKNWNFKIPRTSPELAQELENWKMWQEFKQEIELKPVSTLGAFQKKAEKLSSSVLSLTFQSYPNKLNQPDIKARVTVLLTSLNNLEMFIKLDPIPMDKVDIYLKEVQTNLKVLIMQMEENLAKTKIPKEIGEQEMLEAMDETRRANPEE
ncbi:hypothetical protein [Myroides indicus]|uniref:Lipoprotein n=1 Tax=Myroides indicus TaxID=1323422 RepID=A0A4R7EX30_9FLAO|nr:hypothetical protein [Myroides indicus]TDS57874.1 hypothetical protein C8P70_1146 [Myroides indicus]